MKTSTNNCTFYKNLRVVPTRQLEGSLELRYRPVDAAKDMCIHCRRTTTGDNIYDYTK